MISRLGSKKRGISYPALGFLIPCVGMMLVMLICGYEPFGKSSMLYSDMYHIRRSASQAACPQRESETPMQGN